MFSVEPSHSPRGTFTPSVPTPKATTQQRPFRSIPSSIKAANLRSARLREHQRLQMLAGTPDERAARRALARQALRRQHVLADRLARALKAPCADAGEHLLQHDPGQRVAIGEV